MPPKTRKQIVEALLERYGQTYCDELGIDIARNTPSPLFRWLTASILYSARIGADQATKAAAALADAGWTTAAKMAAASWQERVDVLNARGYARYDESTSRMLGETAEMLVKTYGGDLRRLRDVARCDPSEERKLLKECKGLGDVGVDIFFREAQAVWGELRPFAGRKALKAAAKLGLPADAGSLAELVPEKDLTRLIAALVRIELKNEHDAITGNRKAAKEGNP